MVDANDFRFAQVPRNFWKNMKNQRMFMVHLSQTLEIQQFSDWFVNAVASA